MTGFLLPFTGLLRGGDWPQFLGPDRNGTSAETNLSTAWPTGGPAVLWQKSVGQGFAGPAVAEKKLILFHRLGSRETVEALEAGTGNSLWKFDYPTRYHDDFGFDEGPRATPTISGGAVFTFGAEGALHCLDFNTGKKIWSVDCQKQFSPRKGFFGAACSPLVEGDRVIMNLGGENGAGIVAFEKATGKVAWKAAEDEASYSSPVAATVQGKRFVFVFSRSGLFALNPVAGSIYFQFPWRSPMNASVNAAAPLVIDDKLFLTTSYNTGAVLLRVKESGVEKIWSSDDAISAHYATPVARNGFIYGFHGRQEQGPSFRCIELASGKTRWDRDGLGAGTVTLAGDQLFLMTEKGELIQAAATPVEFKIKNRGQIIGFEVRAASALADGRFYARSKNKLVCVDLRKN